LAVSFCTLPFLSFFLVSQIDLFATILDYLGASSYDKSDGKSLRRFIEKQNYNKNYDDTAAVVELEKVVSRLFGPSDENLHIILHAFLQAYILLFSSTALQQSNFNTGYTPLPNIAIRHKNWKVSCIDSNFFFRLVMLRIILTFLIALQLMIPKIADADMLDMLFDLNSDPYETRNLLADGMGASDRAIGKAEHLRQLILEHMLRNNGKQKFYSDPKYDPTTSRGLVWEVSNRKTWKKMDFWISDQKLFFGQVAVNKKAVVEVENGGTTRTIQDNGVTRVEYLYMGRTTPGSVDVESISVQGSDRNNFFVRPSGPVTIEQDGHLRVKVTYLSTASSNMPNKIDASVVVVYKNNGQQRTETIKIFNAGDSYI